MATGEATIARDAIRARRAGESRLARWARDDWRGQRTLLWGALLVALSATAIVLYYRATPAVITDPDTPTYLHMAQRIVSGRPPFDVVRQPGYPLLIDLVFLVAGHGNLAALAVTQGVLFLMSVVETYALGLLIFRRAWMAFAPAALLGVNLHVLSFVKPLLAESLTLPLVTTLGLALALYLRRPSPRRLWLVAAALIATLLTRSEWAYFAPALVAALAYLTWRRGALAGLWRHLVGMLVACGGVTLAYALGNALFNGYFGVTDVPAINLLGKVMQYRLVGDAPPQYAAIDAIVRASLARGDSNPLTPIRAYAPLAADHYRLAGSYAQAMVERHPLQFGWQVWLTMLHSLSSSLPFLPLPHSPWDGALRPLDALSHWMLSHMTVFVALAALWWIALFWRRASSAAPAVIVEQMSALSLVVMYDLILTSAGSYWYYPRMHTPFDPLLFVVVIGSALLAGERVVRWLREWLRARVAPAPRIGEAASEASHG